MTEPATPQPKDPATPTPFSRFERLTKSLLRVPKKELDAKLAEEKRQREAKRAKRT
jgi:hypothetical protein